MILDASVTSHDGDIVTTNNLQQQESSGSGEPTLVNEYSLFEHIVKDVKSQLGEQEV